MCYDCVVFGDISFYMVKMVSKDKHKNAFLKPLLKQC